MRAQPSILHLDLDAFFASVEQRDKPSLRGKPVIVGGIGPRGVVSTASYEARVFGVGSAMPAHEARRRCPHAAFLGGRFGVYRQASRQVMALLRELSPTIEPLSLDEAFVDLEDSPEAVPFDTAALTARMRGLQDDVARVTGGLSASIGVGTSKFIAKVASELAKPAGVRVVEAGTEVAAIAGLSVRAIPGVGPVTADKLHTFGVDTVADLQGLSAHELNRLVGPSWGRVLHELAFARDDRPVQASREAKSLSVEDTFATDLTDRDELARLLAGHCAQVAERIAAQHLFARTVTIKVKLADFTIVTRSRTLAGATNQPVVIASVAQSLLAGVDVTAGVRLLGAGVSGLTQIAQEALFVDDEAAGESVEHRERAAPAGGALPEPSGRQFPPGADVEHRVLGRGWVWGSGLGRVTVRFETADSGPGPVRTLAVDDPELQPWAPADEASGAVVEE